MANEEVVGLRLQAYGAWGGTEPRFQANIEALRRIAYRPTLIIGLGGTGLTVTQKVRRRIRNFFRREDRDIFQFLVFDTIGQATSSREERLTEREFRYLGGIDGDGLIRRLESFPRLEEWWPRKDFLPGYIRYGARSVRCIGRLALFHRINTVQGDLQEAVGRAISIMAGKLIERPTTVTAAKVYIISSLCGGTGSGMFIDVAYLARNALTDQGQEVSVTGILAMPEVFFGLDRSPVQQSWWRANTYAALKELDHFMATRHYYVQYSPLQVIEQTKKPLDVCYLIGTTNERGQTLQDYEGIMEMIAEEIFTEIISPIGEQQEAIFENIDSVNHVSRDKKPAAYSSFCIASLVFLAEDLAGYCATRNHIEFVDSVLLWLSPEMEKQANRLEEQFVVSQMIREKGHDELIDYLGSDDEGNPLGGLEVYNDELRVPNDELLSTVAGIEEDRHTLLAQHARTMIKRRQEKLASVTNALYTELSNALVDSDKGLPVALRFLEVLSTQMEAYKVEEMQREEKGSSAEIAKLGKLRMGPNEDTELGEVQMRINDALSSHRFVRANRINRSVNDYSSTCTSVVRAHFELERRRQGALFYDEFQREINGLIRQLKGTEATLRNEQNNLRLRAERFVRSNRFMTGEHALAMGVVNQRQLGTLYDEYALMPNTATERRAAYQRFMAHLREKGHELATDGPSSLFVRDDGLWLSSQLYDFLGHMFIEYFTELDVISVIRKLGGEELLETYIPHLFTRAVPFWNWDETEIFGGTVAVESKNAMGIGEEEWAEEVRRQVREAFTPVETKDKYAITMLRTSHGLPLHALRPLAREWKYHSAYQEFMEQWRTGGGRPLHISKVWESSFADIHPREQMENYELFAVGLAMGDIYEKGYWYYVRPIQEPGEPAKDPYQLQHGLRQALEVFVHQPEAVKTVRQRVDEQIIESRVTIRDTLRAGRDDFYLKSREPGVHRQLFAEMKAWIEQFSERNNMPLPPVTEETEPAS